MSITWKNYNRNFFSTANGKTFTVYQLNDKKISPELDKLFGGAILFASFIIVRHGRCMWESRVSNVITSLAPSLFFHFTSLSQ
jgi:hypothetical protein